MVEILKPTEYKQIFECINEEWNEEDIMEHLDNFAVFYEKTTYHFYRTLCRKLADIDPYNSNYEVIQFMEGYGSDIPSIEHFKDAPNPSLRFAKVYADFLLAAEDRREIGDWQLDEGHKPILKFKSRLNEEQLNELYDFLVDEKMLEAHSVQNFISLFNENTVTEEKMVWKLKYNNTRFSDNFSLLTLMACIGYNKNLVGLDENDSAGLIPAIVDNFISAGEKNTIGKGTLGGSYNKWFPRMEKLFKPSDKNKDVQPIDPISKKIKKFIDTLL